MENDQIFKEAVEDIDRWLAKIRETDPDSDSRGLAPVEMFKGVCDGLVECFELMSGQMKPLVDEVFGLDNPNLANEVLAASLDFADKYVEPALARFRVMQARYRVATVTDGLVGDQRFARVRADGFAGVEDDCPKLLERLGHGFCKRFGVLFSGASRCLEGNGGREREVPLRNVAGFTSEKADALSALFAELLKLDERRVSNSRADDEVEKLAAAVVDRERRRRVLYA